MRFILRFRVALLKAFLFLEKFPCLVLWKKIVRPDHKAKAKWLRGRSTGGKLPSARSCGCSSRKGTGRCNSPGNA